jgi:hypothetical protein
MQLLIGFIKQLTAPLGSVGTTVQLAIVPPELLKVMSVMAEPIKAIQLHLLLLSLKPMDQSQRGVIQSMEAQHPLVVAIPRFIQLRLPLSLLKLMGRSRRGVKIMEVPVATAVNVAGAGFVDDVAKLTVAVSV